MAKRRTRSITTKLTDDEYARVQRTAGEKTVSEWARGLVLRELQQLDRPPVEQQLMAELWALRFIVLNTFPAVVPLPDDREALIALLRRLIQEADQKKARKAQVILEGRDERVGT
jgi:hypothetical protein